MKRVLIPALSFILVSNLSAALGVLGGWGFTFPTPPATLSNVLAIAAGDNFGLALKDDGTVAEFDWQGNWLFGQPASLTNVTRIGAFGLNRIAVTADSNVVTWGGWVPNPPAGLTNIVAAAIGENHALALREVGSVVAWGENTYGQTNVPVNLTNAVAIDAGRNHNLALRGDGTVVAWGDNQKGQCDVPPGLAEVQAISAGGAYSVALKSNGTVVAWGDNTYGQTNVPAGLAGVMAISAGESHCLALKTNGMVEGWGWDLEMQAGGGQWQQGLSMVAASRGSGWFYSLAVGPGPFLSRVYFTGAGNSNTWWEVERREGESLSLLAGRIISAEPPAFQWLFNGQPIADATNETITISNLQYSHSGFYSLSATSAGGSMGLSQGSPKLLVFAGNDDFQGAKILPSIGGRAADFFSGGSSEPGEPYHAGSLPYRTYWYSWTAPASGTVFLDTLGSDFDTVLAVYTGSTLRALEWVAADDDSGEPVPASPFGGIPGRTSRLQFQATAGVAYQIVVGAFTAYTAYTTAILNLSMDRPILDAFLDNGLLALQAGSAPGGTLVIESSNDLRLWTPLATNVVPVSGIVNRYVNQPAGGANRFFRAVRY